MLDKIKLTIKNSFIYSIGNLSIAVIGYILIPIYTDKFDLSVYGAFGLLDIFYRFFVAAFGLSIYQAFNRWYFDKEYCDKRNVLFFTLSFFLLIWLIIINYLIWTFSESISILLIHSPDYGSEIQLLSLSGSMQILALMPLTLLKLQQKSVLYSISNLTKFLTILISTIYLILNLNYKIEGIYLGQIIGQSFFFVVLSRYILKNSKIKFETKVLKEIIVYSVPLMFSTVSSILIVFSDRYILNMMESLEDVGIYSFAGTISSIIKVLIVQSVQLAISPLLYSMIDKPNNKRFYSKIMKYLSYIVLHSVLFISLFSSEIIHFFASKNDYYMAIQFVPILSFSVFFLMLKEYTAIGIHIKKNTKVIGYISFMVLIFNLICNFTLISFFGIWGAAITNLFSQLIYFLILYHYAQKSFAIPYEIKNLIKLILVTITILIVSYSFIDEYNLYLIPVKFVFLVLPSFTLYYLNYFEEIEIIKIQEGFSLISRPKKLIELIFSSKTNKQE